MWDNTLGKHIRRTNRNLLVTAVVLVAIVAGTSILMGRYLRNAVMGAQEITAAELAKDPEPSSLSRYYVTFKPEKAMDTGLQMVETTRSKYSQEVKSSRVTARYLFAKADDRILVVKAGADAKLDQAFTGSLEALPPDVAGQIGGDLEPEVRARLLGLMLDATGGFGIGAYVTLAIGAIVMLIAFYCWKVSATASADFSKHPIAKALERHGDPEKVADEIDRELAPGAGATTIAGVTISASWLLQPSFTSVSICKLDELVWLYQKVITRRTNGIKTGTSYQAVLCDRHGHALAIPTSEDNVKRILAAALGGAPWALTGYDEEVERMWKGSQKTMQAVIDQRRAQYEAAAAGQPSAQPKQARST